MEGYDVLAMGGEKIGTVAGRVGDVLLVEHGLLRKSRRCVPMAFVAEADDAARCVQTSVGKELVDSAPEADGDTVDEQEVLRHFGLAGGYEQPETLGYGVVEPDDPAWSSEVQAERNDVTPAGEERARIREGIAAGAGPLDQGPPSPGATGGDRRRDAG